MLEATQRNRMEDGLKMSTSPRVMILSVYEMAFAWRACMVWMQILDYIYNNNNSNTLRMM